MNRDFTLEVYLKLLDSFKQSGYTFKTFGGYLSKKNSPEKILILRHDIDASPQLALDFGRVEHNNGIQATYYFKISQVIHCKEIITEIASLGHEIGYHYEDFARAKGNPSYAIKSFERNLAYLRELAPVSTICMDGKILSKWDNLDLWTYYRYQAYGIIGEPYLDLDFNKVLYLTDTGRRWNAVQFSMYDKVTTRFSYTDKSTFNIIRDLEEGKLPDQIMINLHPQRWHSGYFKWTLELLAQWIKNSIKYLIIKRRSLQE